MFARIVGIFIPHYRNNHRSHLLKPVGLTVLMTLVLLTQSSMSLIAAHPPRGMILGFASNITVEQVLAQTNAERVSRGLKALELNPTLSQAAEAKAAHMFANNYWAHIAPDGTTPWEFIKKSGLSYQVAGENLARDFDITENMVSAWMASPTHKANIVHEKFTQTGIAVVNGNLEGIDTTLIVQMFSLPSGELAIPRIESVSTTADNLQMVSEKSELSYETPIASEKTAEVLSDTNQVHYTSPLQIKSVVASAIVILLIGVILIDEFLANKKNLVRLVGRNFAHISFLLAVYCLIQVLSKPGGLI